MLSQSLMLAAMLAALPTATAFGRSIAAASWPWPTPKATPRVMMPPKTEFFRGILTDPAGAHELRRPGSHAQGQGAQGTVPRCPSSSHCWPMSPMRKASPLGTTRSLLGSWRRYPLVLSPHKFPSLRGGFDHVNSRLERHAG